MTTQDAPGPVRPGEPAPDFTLPAIHREGLISSADYRGRKPLLLALFRGLWCPFCRRAIAQLGTAREKLDAIGVETLAVVATTPENARLYFRFRPSKVPLAADPELVTHRAFRLPKPAVTPELIGQLATTHGNPTGELSEPVSLTHVGDALDRLHGFKATETDLSDKQRQVAQLKGQFLVDRAGIVRWANIEASEGLAGV